MVVYLDLVFLLNSLTDVMALYITARLSSLALRGGRVIAAALSGGLYGVLCCLPIPAVFRGFGIQMLVAMLLVGIAFGKQKTFLRLWLLFLFLSCTLGGAVTVVSQHFMQFGLITTLKSLDWKVFILVSVICYFVLSVVFRGSAKHAVAGQLCRISITLGGKKITLDALYDTGHTLYDPCNGTSVVTVWYRAADPLWSKEERAILEHLETQESIRCAEKLGEVVPGRFRLIPYRAVGVSCAMLLAFQADEVWIDTKGYGKMTIALSPTPVSDGGGYTALWGGERNGKAEDVGTVKNLATSDIIAAGADPAR